MTDQRIELVAARATGIGVGLIVLMVVWLIGNRIASPIWGVPVGPTIAILVATLLGVVASIRYSKRFTDQVRAESDRH